MGDICYMLLEHRLARHARDALSNTMRGREAVSEVPCDAVILSKAPGITTKDAVSMKARIASIPPRW